MTSIGLSRAVLAGLLLGAALPCRAMDPAAGTGGSAFMRLGQGSTVAMGMGQAYVALAEGTEALTWNPAGLAVTQQRELAYSYLRHVQGLDTPLYMAYAHPTGRTVWGANLAYLNDDNFDARDANGIPQPNANVIVRDGFATLGVGRSFWYEKLFLGASLKGIHEDNAGSIHDTLVGDAGALFRPNSVLSLGFALQNFGSSTANVPSIAHGGAAARLGDFLTVSFEVNKAADDVARVGFGAEFHVPEEYLQAGELAFRVGYYSRDSLGQSFKSELKGLGLDHTSNLSFGLGLFTSQAFGYGLGLDYALVPFGALGAVDQLSVKLKF